VKYNHESRKYRKYAYKKMKLTGIPTKNPSPEITLETEASIHRQEVSKIKYGSDERFVP